MSKAEPMTLKRRLFHYLGNRDPYMVSEQDLTPAQRRRAWHKAHRSGVRGGPGTGEELRGRKGRATPRRPRRG
jgi:hypothetical protein